MPIYYYWGDDEFTIAKAVEQLRNRIDPNWASFNYTQYPADATVEGLNQAMTPPFGCGDRLVWLADTNLGQNCSEDLLVELERTFPALPENSVLLLTSTNKADGRLKSTKLLQKYADIREFALIPPWETSKLFQQVQKVAQEVGVKLTQASVNAISEAVGNNTRQLYNELEKLRLYAGDTKAALDIDVVSRLIEANSQTSLDLVKAIASGNIAKSLTLIAQLLNRNEPALRIVATLIGQFRTWLWVKIATDTGERDKKVIAQAAEISNPNRVYFLQQEVQTLSVQQLASTLPVLLALELSLKQGGEEKAVLQTKIIELCQIFSQR
ncbi:DNA polymerase III subunit delta [Aliterella atlantica]|uniref:DNA polymerase III subunit delta n=1 Tax=Aliterella atlantica CENA595 TaxID=1618023 RepID=A0A0D8ZYR7_9CYAN|nr:DNA polymerase III subunit delta [Aliterella atlantica]KJH73547.1 DNA polymerase III subunit delta [Aliterella atlantica CENA595]